MSTKEYFFRITNGWKSLGDDFPNDHRSVECKDGLSCHVTTDAEWVKRQKSNLEIIQPEAAYGIKKIIIVEGMLESDPISYKIEILVENKTGTITLSDAEIFSYAKFRQKYLASFQEMLPRIKNAEWEVILTPLIETADRIQEDTNDAPIVIDVCNLIELSEVVTDKNELTIGAGNKIWLDKATDTIKVQSGRLEPIAERYKITLQRLAELLKNYRASNAKLTRLGRKREYLWCFKPGLFDLRMEKNE